MEKSKDLQLFCYAHFLPEYGLVDDEFHTPMHVGKELHKDVEVCEVCDNTGDNISMLNGLMSELTGMYWVWKNVNDVKYVGTEHYRRRFGLSPEEIAEILKEKDLITFKPILCENSLLADYVGCHSEFDMFATEYIVRRFFPDYTASWDKYITNGHMLFASNCFISTKENYDKACEFVFGALRVFIETFGIFDPVRLTNHVRMFCVPSCPDEKNDGEFGWIKYQMRLGGFLAERLFTLYFLHNFPEDKIYTTEIIEMEKQE